MPSDDYTSAVGGGLKLKGGISKGKKKKKAKKDVDKDDQALTAGEKKEDAPSGAESRETEDVKDGDVGEEGIDEGEGTDGHDGKTEAERKYEEMRKKRLQDRLRKEGSKTHKQRVEELNRYLSSLSEHHDMPRIGPG